MTRDDTPARRVDHYEPEDNAPHGPDGRGIAICVAVAIAVLAWAVLA